MAIISIGAILGSFPVRWIAERFGRKRGLLWVLKQVVTLCCSFGFFIQALALLLAISAYYFNSFYLYGVSRVLLGFAQSILMTLTSVFLMEARFEVLLLFEKVSVQNIVVE